jgi:hypothetical protein
MNENMPIWDKLFVTAILENEVPRNKGQIVRFKVLTVVKKKNE